MYIIYTIIQPRQPYFNKFDQSSVPILMAHYQAEIFCFPCTIMNLPFYHFLECLGTVRFEFKRSPRFSLLTNIFIFIVFLFTYIYIYCLHNVVIFQILILVSHIAPKYLHNIVEIFLGNIVRLLKYFETCH